MCWRFKPLSPFVENSEKQHKSSKERRTYIKMIGTGKTMFFCFHSRTWIQVRWRQVSNSGDFQVILEMQNGNANKTDSNRLDGSNVSKTAACLTMLTNIETSPERRLLSRPRPEQTAANTFRPPLPQSSSLPISPASTNTALLPPDQPQA